MLILLPSAPTIQALSCVIFQQASHVILIFKTGWRRCVFESVHCLLYPGVWALLKLASYHFCVAWFSQRSEGLGGSEPRCIGTPRHHLNRFNHVHVDLVGSLPPSRGFTHLPTIIDCTTRWPSIVPPSSTAPSGGLCVPRHLDCLF